jgi:hypothetical protein
MTRGQTVGMIRTCDIRFRKQIQTVRPMRRSRVGAGQSLADVFAVTPRLDNRGH